jgi:hypothetical protein
VGSFGAFGAFVVRSVRRPGKQIRTSERSERPNDPNDYFGLNGCLAVFEPAITSFTAGLPPSARSMDSLVA